METIPRSSHRVTPQDRPSIAHSRPRNIGTYFGLVPRRYEFDYVDASRTGGCGPDRALAIAPRSTMPRARIVPAGRRAIVMHAMLRNEIEFAPA